MQIATVLAFFPRFFYSNWPQWAPKPPPNRVGDINLGVAGSQTCTKFWAAARQYIYLTALRCVQQANFTKGITTSEGGMNRTRLRKQLHHRAALCPTGRLGSTWRAAAAIRAAVSAPPAPWDSPPRPSGSAQSQLTPSEWPPAGGLLVLGRLGALVQPVSHRSVPS